MTPTQEKLLSLVQQDIKDTILRYNNVDYAQSFTNDKERIIYALEYATQTFDNSSTLLHRLNNFFSNYNPENSNFSLDHFAYSRARESLNQFYFNALISIIKATMPSNKSLQDFLAELPETKTNLNLYEDSF